VSLSAPATTDLSNLTPALTTPRFGVAFGAVDVLADKPDVEVRDGRLGRAAHANRPYAGGDVILRAWGEPTRERTRFTIQVDHELHVVPPEPLVCFNHSCEPNCGLIIKSGSDVILVHALEAIEANTELTLDYDTFEWEVQHLGGSCLCHTRSCRGAVRGFKHLPVRLREAYGPYVAEYLREIELGVRTARP
jgi:hypothetical protein